MEKDPSVCNALNSDLSHPRLFTCVSYDEGGYAALVCRAAPCARGFPKWILWWPILLCTPHMAVSSRSGVEGDLPSLLIPH